MVENVIISLAFSWKITLDFSRRSVNRREKKEKKKKFGFQYKEIEKKE